MHQQCYGIEEVPTGDWVCDVCVKYEKKEDKSLPCPFCSIRGGAMKSCQVPHDLFIHSLKTQSCNKEEHAAIHSEDSNKPGCSELELHSASKEPPTFSWLHLSCASWLPEFKFSPMKAPISGLEMIDKKRFRLTCLICKVRGIGCCVQCAKGKCQVAFHVECARLAGFAMETIITDEDTMHVIYCEKHRPLKLRKNIEEDKKQVEEEIMNFCKLTRKCLKKSTTCGVNEKKRPKSSTNRTFTKQDKKTLVLRIKKACRKYASLVIKIANPSEGSYKLIQQSPYYCACQCIKYTDTLDKSKFPWNYVKFDKFTTMNCYHKYIEIVPDELTFNKKILPKKIERKISGEERADFDKLVDSATVWPMIDRTRYCSCKKMDCEVPGERMIRNIVYYNEV